METTWWWCGDDEKGQVRAQFEVSLSVRCSGALATEKHSGLCRLFLLCLQSLVVPPDPVELGPSCTAEEEVDTKQVPVFRDYDQRVSGPDQACGCQHCRLGGTEFFCWSSHISQTRSHQTPFKHRSPEENCFWTRRVVVERSQFRRQHVLNAVQNPVIGRSQRSHDCRWTWCKWRD